MAVLLIKDYPGNAIYIKIHNKEKKKYCGNLRELT